MKHFYLDVLADTICNNWNHTAIIDYDIQSNKSEHKYTYGCMFEKITWLCNLFDQSGLVQGDHIAICGANSSNWIIAYLAIAAYRAVSVTILPTQTADDTVKQIVFSDAKALFVSSDIWKEIESQSALKTNPVIALEDFSIISGEEIAIDHYQQKKDISFNKRDENELAQICFTSGTNNRPKGVMLSYGNINANVLYSFDSFLKYRNMPTTSILPMSHMYGLVVEVLLPLCVGTTIYIINNIYPFKYFVNAIHSISPKIATFVPTFLEHMAEYARKNGIQNLKDILGNNIDFVSIGGSSLSIQCERLLRDSDISIAMGYGMTECAPRISLSLSGEHRSGSVGKIVSTLKGRIINGEILVKGENVMLGYYKDEEATHRKIDADGWLHTGDAGYLDDDGYLYVTGRIENDMIVLPSGENIYPQNIEKIINSIDGVAESLVIDRSGKLVALIYASMPLDVDNLLSTINPELPLFSQLYDIEFVSEPFKKTAKQSIKRYLYH